MQITLKPNETLVVDFDDKEEVFEITNFDGYIITIVQTAGQTAYQPDIIALYQREEKVNAPA